MIDKPTEEEEKKIKTFMCNGCFELSGEDYKYFGVKWGHLKYLKEIYTLKEIKTLLDRIEELINYGAICSECLSFCEYWSEEETNAEGFKCLNCGEEF